jgi:signal transduction histidine kinase
LNVVWGFQEPSMRFDATRLLWALAILALVLPIAFFAAFGWVSYRQHFDGARAQLVRTLDVVREHAIRVFETHVLIANQVELLLRGLSDAEIRAREAELNKELKRIVDAYPQVQDIWVIDADGRPLVTGNVFPLPPTLDLSDRTYFRVFKEGKVEPDEIYISRVLRGRAQDVTFFQVAKARTPGPNGEFNGVDVVSVEPRYFQEFFAQVIKSGVDTVGLIREDGAILARSPEQSERLEELPDASPFARQVKQQPAFGVYESRSVFDGVQRIIAYQHLPDHPVYVAVGRTQARIADAWRQNFLSHMIFAIPATLGFVALALFAARLSRRETDAVHQLRDEAERRELAEGQLRQAQKMEAIGRLTGGVAHDFNNLLTIVIGNIDLAKRRMNDADAKILQAIENARVGATRAATLTQRLLAFSRQQPLAPAAVDVNKLVSGMSELLRRTLGETVSVETVLAGGLWRAHADANQLESAILNLAVNARDAMPDGGKLTIETANAHLDDRYAAAHDVRAGQYVMIAVADTGAGMTPEVMEKVFDPFFTTKPVGQGTGLGLSQVYGFAKQSFGHVAIYSEVNHGTVVKLYLPKLQKAEDHHAAETARADAAPVEAGDRRTVLVVEDDDMVRQLSVDALESAGYTVIHCEDARRGLGLLNAHPEIDLLFTDVVLTGGMNGRQLADEAKKMHAGIKVLFTTGYTPNAIVHQGRLDEGINFIGKPFSPASLVAKVQAVLKA